MSHLVEGKVQACCHTIAYWFSGDHKISEALKKELEEHAGEHAKECLVKKYREGELSYIDSDTGYDYTGWWRIEI
jgi:hypothetical protein